MTEEERDNGLENLFREKLGENELVAGSDLTARLKGRLGRREFFRFTPSRFNIWYLTAAVAALTVAGLILLTGTSTGESSISPVPDSESAIPVMSATSGLDTLNTDDAGETIPDTAVPSQVPFTYPERDSANTSASRDIETNHQGISTRRESAITAGDLTHHGDSGGPVTLSTTDHGNMAVIRQPVTALYVTASPQGGCAPLRVSFSCNAPEGGKISWSFGDGGTSSLHDPDYMYDIPGRYRVILTVMDSRGRTSTATVRIDVWEKPRAAFEVRDTELTGEDDRIMFVNMSAGAAYYRWDFGDGTFSTLSDPSYRYNSTGEWQVTLVAYSAEGCADSVTVSDLFTGRGMYIRFPNAFIPNPGGPTGGYYNQRTDEESQVFHPVYGGVSDYNLKIYSKAGLLVFESNDPAMGWDGWHKGGLCAPGVYVWKARGTFRNGNTFIKAGDVTLLKY